jgi:hypothetical protein
MRCLGRLLTSLSFVRRQGQHVALLERSVAEQRDEAVMQVLRHKIPVSEVAARFGVSRQSVHTWIRRYEQDGLVGLVDRSQRATIPELDADNRRGFTSRSTRPGGCPTTGSRCPRGSVIRAAPSSDPAATSQSDT